MKVITIKPIHNWDVRHTLMTWLKQLVVAALYVLLGHIIHHYYTSHGIGILWPASGLVLAIVLIGGKRYIWSVLLGSILLHAPFKESFLLIIGISIANVLQVFTGSWLLTHNKHSVVSLNTLHDYLRLISLGGFVASLLAAIVAASVLLQTGIIVSADYLTNVLRWWMGNSLGIVLITPLILAWWQKPPESLTNKQQCEAILLVSITFIVGQVIFLGWLTEYLMMPPKAFIMLLPVTLIAIKFGLRATTLVLTIIAIQALAGAYLKTGYFANEIATANLYNYWLYILILSGVGIALTTYVNELKQKELSLRKSETHLRLSQTSGGIGSWEADLTNNKLIWSDSCRALIGLNHQPTWEEFSNALHPEDRQRVFDVADSHIKKGTKYEIEYRVITSNSDIRWIRSAGQVERNKKGKPTIMRGIAQDVTERKLAENEIERLAFYDPLTLLPNRRLLMDRLKQALAASVRSGLEGGLLFIDLDNFKTLNDTHGHNAGDLLLQQVSERLTACVREIDTVARLGGDEFVIMLENLSKNHLNAATQLEIMGEKIIASLNQPYQFAGNYHSTASIGAVLFNNNQQTIEELMRQADIAMYQAKAAGRNTLRFFNPEMQACITARALLEADLRLALAENQFTLYYQLQTTHHQQIIGAEVLIRWRHPQRGLVPPNDFIPLAEETGLIIPIGQWLLKTACAQIKSWESSVNTQHLQLAVNVSARQFQQTDFVTQVQQILTDSGIKPELLKLELTESMILDDVTDTIHKMNVLRTIGVRFSMDDFGTGYSSLAYLTQLPLDQLKIDQSFINNIGVKSTDAVIVQTIIGMAHNLGIEVIAEGVETETQRVFLEQHHCKLCQGYLFSRPVPIEQFELLLQNNEL